LPECAEITISQQPYLAKQALLSLASLITSQLDYIGVSDCAALGGQADTRQTDRKWPKRPDSEDYAPRTGSVLPVFSDWSILK
jgi:hypothetical protein